MVKSFLFVLLSISSQASQVSGPGGSGGGGVAGPGSSIDRGIATWNGTGGTDLFSNTTKLYDSLSNSYWGLSIPTIVGVGLGSGGVSTGNFPAWAISTASTATSNGAASIVLTPGAATGSGSNASGGGIFGIAGSATDASATGGDIQFNSGDNPAGAAGNIMLNAGTGVSTIGKFSVSALNFSVSSAGVISDILSSDSVGLTLRANTGGQTNKVFKMFRSNGDECFSIDNNGAVSSCGSFTINGISGLAGGIIEFGQSGSTLFDMRGTDASTAYPQMVRIVSNKAANKALSVKAATSQSANIQEWQDDSDNPLTVINKNGNVGLHCYAGTALPTATQEGEFICNNTDHQICFWNGSAWKRPDGTTACH